MFDGFIDEGQAFSFLVQTVDETEAPVDADAVPTWRCYGQNGLVASGSGSAAFAESGSISGATNVNPIVVTTTASHGITTGQPVVISGVGGNLAANGSFVATYLSATTFSIPIAGNGAYTSGGSWHSTGLYRVTLTGSILSSLEAGKTYTVVVTYAVGGDVKTETHTFTVR